MSIKQDSIIALMESCKVGPVGFEPTTNQAK